MELHFGNDIINSISKKAKGQTSKEIVKEAQKKLLIEGAREAYKEWAVANANFDKVEDNNLIDYYIYTIKAAEVKMGYYLNKIKKEYNKKS